MKHYLVTYTIHDGENEYTQRVLAVAKDIESASKQAEKEVSGVFNKSDYRIAEWEMIDEIEKAEFEVLLKYFYCITKIGKGV